MRMPLPSREEIASLAADGGGEFNRLIFEKSPYLLQHARNPVDWRPWGAEALEAARREEKPIFLSIGYSTCHWCHVMARESFEDAEIARLLNENYLAIKVDREERPDIDEIYMQATQLMTGRGGWPNSVWLTPDARPWYAGTYFPREDRMGHSGFRSLLTTLADIWKNRRQDVEMQADQLSESARQLSAAGITGGGGRIERSLVGSALEELDESYDESHGGFGGPPKFPPHEELRLLFYENAERPNPRLAQMSTRTLDAIAAGGIHDHVGGGFHRYATDVRWLLPHFEKMLYDNAQLARSYVDAYLATGDEKYRRVAEGTFTWAIREMIGEGGGFHSAIDADSEGEEGRFYVWTRAEIVEALGQEEGAFFAQVYGVEERGNFRDEATGERRGTSILHLPEPLAAIARREKVSLAYLRDRLAADRAELLKARAARARPDTDDKVLAAWNGLMIGSLAYGGRQLRAPAFVDAARAAADFVLTRMRRDGRLLRSYRDGEATVEAYLDDYALMAGGLLELHEATREPRWLEEAEALARVMKEHYRDRDAGGFFFTSDDAEPLLVRSKDPYDKAIPSGNAAAAQALLGLWRETGDAEYRDAAVSTIDAFLGVAQVASRAMLSLVTAVAMYLDESARARGESAGGAADDEPDARASAEHVAVEAFASRRRAAPGQTVEVAVRLDIDEGWHINSSCPLQDYLEATSVEVAGDGAAAEAAPVYPDAREVTLPLSDEPLSVYEGTVWVRVPVKIAAEARAGPSAVVIEVHVQPCSSRDCLASETLTLSLPLEVDEHAAEETRHAAIFDTILARR